MKRRRKAIAGAVLALCVVIGGTVGVMRAFAGGGEGDAPPVVVATGQIPSVSTSVKQTPGVKLQATWVHSGSGHVLSPGSYDPLDTPITVICKNASCQLVVDKMVVVYNSTNAAQVAPCVTVDSGTGGGTCSWLGSSNGWPAGANYGGTTTEGISLSKGAHTVNVGAYTGSSGVSVQAYTFVYRLYR